MEEIYETLPDTIREVDVLILGDSRELIVPCGSTLGGGSSIKLMMYSRTQQSDYNSWNVPGWSAEDMTPYLRKLETYHGPGPRTFHGFNGPINVFGGTYRANRSGSHFVQAAGNIGYHEIENLTSLDANNGVQRALKYTGTDGTRQDAASRYSILSSRVEISEPACRCKLASKRVIFDNKRASGLEYRPNPKLVVVPSGALGIPSILERSGLGNPEDMKKAGVDVVADLPGASENYQVHHLLDETIDAIVGGRLDAGEPIQESAAILGWNAMDTTCKIRPTDAEVAALGPDFQALFPGDPYLAPALQYFTVGLDRDDKAKFTTGFFSDIQGVDIKKHVWAYKKQGEIFRRMETYRGELPILHPPFSPESPATLIQLNDEPAPNVMDIVYTLEDDQVIEDYARAHVETTWHSLGTYKMGPREEISVIDAKLNAYGVEGL
ncbi:GMC oxidoreductase-domain-containing protein [Lophiotrema nucula]|uniref:GMC oxidoreductase-domain-containing protein n=1 Tax=Lophiotrema nucula TaxID=690887 RepID=A0A6A5ZKH2_9PLEO|nr:GMC oxidoreductase-domain-containing protein [Lophiotrema nucula]